MTKYMNVKNGMEISFDGRQIQILAGDRNPRTSPPVEAEKGSIYIYSDPNTFYCYPFVKAADGENGWREMMTSQNETNLFINLFDTPENYDDGDSKLLIVEDEEIVFTDNIDCKGF